MIKPLHQMTTFLKIVKFFYFLLRKKKKREKTLPEPHNHKLCTLQLNYSRISVIQTAQTDGLVQK